MGIIAEHWESLPRWYSAGGPSAGSTLLPLGMFVAAPLLAAGVLIPLDLTASSSAIGGLLAGVGVFGGLLFQVLAWVSGRVGAIADAIGDRVPSAHELQTLKRLDIARANVAYAAILSIVTTCVLGVIVMMADAPAFMAVVALALLFHLAATLFLVTVRINSIGRNDRVSALTGHARVR